MAHRKTDRKKLPHLSLKETQKEIYKPLGGTGDSIDWFLYVMFTIIWLGIILL